MAKVTKQQLIADFKRVAQELEKRPTLSEYNEHGEHSSTPIYDRFGSFENFKEKAGFETGEQKVSDETLLEDLQQVAEQIGRAPPIEVYADHGSHDPKTLKRRFGNWHQTLQTAGLEPTEHSEHWKDNEPVVGEKKYGATETVECAFCGDTKQVQPSETKARDRFYCNYTCKGNFMSQQTGEDARSWEGGKVEIECEWCGDTDRVRPAKVDSARFCTQRCMLEWRSETFTGEDHHRWKDNPKYRYYGPNWEDQAEKCRERDNYTCQICGRSNENSLEEWDESLTAHHIIRFYDFDGWETANQLPNLITACKNCHGNLEAGRVPLPQDAEARFREWVATTEKTVSDATADIS